MKILHFFPSSSFVYSFVNKVNNCFNSNEHLFIVFGHGIGGGKKIHSYNKEKVKFSNVIFCNDLEKNLKMINYELKISDKVVFYSLFLPNKMIFFFASKPWLYKKYIWSIWSNDLYNYINYIPNSYKDKMNFEIYKLLIRNMDTIVGIYGDYEVAKKKFKTKAKFKPTVYSFDMPLYPLNTKKFSTDREITIQVGNSADEESQHLQVFEKLFCYKDEKIKIICPLSYGEKEYGMQVEKLGKMIFDDKFLALTNFLEYDKYVELLNTINIAVFHTKIHRALGNIYVLLYFGKKIYINDTTSVYKFIKDNGFIIFRTQDIPNENFFTDLLPEEKQINRDKVIHLLSSENFKRLWGKVFY